MRDPAVDVVNQFISPPLDLTDSVDRVLLAMFNDITDRRGLRQEFDQCDAGIKGEILSAWRTKIAVALTERSPS